MIDPKISLAFSLVSNQGTYALLLGSGISRSSGIPTGWEITINLINKLAELSGEKIENSPEEWYENKFGEIPNYSILLNEVFKTQTQRSNYLRQFFEPTDDEKEQGIKTPTEAHKAIAKLVRNGLIKVIITTNFDRLLESALELENVHPNVISNSDSIKGAIPIIHSKCAIIKINGDYLDTRTKNTQKELEKYEIELDNLLDRVFDEFGLIICGWSAEWDIGLIKAIKRCKNRRYAAYWIAKDSITETAQEIIELKDASVIKNITADIFFQDLLEKSISILDTQKAHPLSIKTAIATVKRYLAEDKYKINLHDLVVSETKNLRDELLNNSFNLNEPFTDAEFLKRVKFYENKSEILINILLTICYWGKQYHAEFIKNSIQSLSGINRIAGGYEVYIKLRNYPSLMVMYATGISALINNRYDIFKTILVDTEIRIENESGQLCHLLTPYDVIDGSIAAKLPGRNNRQHTPFNDYLFEKMRIYFLEILFDEKQFITLFDKFEYILALVYADIDNEGEVPRFWAPPGSYCWRNVRYSNSQHIANILQKELDVQKDKHPILKAGLFGGNLDRILFIKKRLDEFISSLGWSR